MKLCNCSTCGVVLSREYKKGAKIIFDATRYKIAEWGGFKLVKMGQYTHKQPHCKRCYLAGKTPIFIGKPLQAPYVDPRISGKRHIPSKVLAESEN